MTDQTWTVRVDWLDKAGPMPAEAKLDTWTSALADYSPAVSLEPGGAYERASATITVLAATLRQAIQTAVWMVEGAAGRKAIGVEALQTEEFDRRLNEPQIPPLIGQVEMATRLGVSRQRVAQLATERQDFPPEVVRTAAGPLYVEAHFDAWVQGWQRRPGRPPKKTEESA